MSFQVGIVGLPNVGKSSLFQVLTKKTVDVANYPFATIDPNVGVVTVPDERLQKLTELEHSAKTVATTIEFVDIAGLVKDAHKGEGLGNQFLSHIREVDAIAEVVRVFEDPNVIHVAGDIDPTSDVSTIEIELAMADLSTVSKRLENLRKQSKAGLSKPLEQELGVLEQLETQLNAGNPARDLDFADELMPIVRDLNLLTIKPLLYVLNVSEEQVQTIDPAKFGLPPDRTIVMAVKVETELANLAPTEASEYLQSLGWKTSGLDRLIQASYKLLNLITFLTTGPDETRAWTVPIGTPAPQAAGVIHSDFADHFIRAEVVSYPDLITAGSWDAAKTAGKLRIEGKAYIVQDGDVVFFRVDA